MKLQNILLYGTCLLVSTTLMANSTWNGSVSTDWCTAANWDGGIPADNDDVTINACTTCPIISSSCSAEADKITINAGGTLTVRGTLTGSDGNIEIEGGNMVVEAGANITNFKDLKFKDVDGGSYTQTGGTVNMNDDFKMENDGNNNTVNISGGNFTLGKSFEIKGTGNDINISGGNVSFLYVKYYGGGGIEGCGDSSCSKAAEGTGNTFDITGSTTLSVTGFDLGTNTGNNNQINIAGTVTPVLDESNFFGPDATGPGGTVVINNEPLPVELFYFHVNSLSTGVEINWATMQEINNDYFTIERSFDSYEFHPVAIVRGAGNHSGELNYSYTDHPQSSSEVIYYRLVQTDFDGTSETFDIQGVSNENIKAFAISVFPTKASSNETIRVALPDTEIHSYALHLIDMSGRVSNLDIDADYNTLSFNAPTNLETGNYILKGTIDGSSFTKRIILNQ